MIVATTSASSSSFFPSLSPLSSSSSSSFSRLSRRNFSPASSLLFPSRTAVRVSQRRCQTLGVLSMHHPHRSDTDLGIAERYAVKAVPVVLLFKNGQRCESVVGTMPKDFYVTAIRRVLDS